MKYQELDELEKQVMSLAVKRRALGGFDVNAADIQFLTEVCLMLVQHLKGLTRKPKDVPLVGS